MPGVIVPRKTVLEIAKLIESADGEVEIALSTAKIRFAIDGVVVTSKLIDGTFPDYERVIPRNNEKVLEVDTRLFTQAVDRVSTVSSEKGRAVKLNVTAERVSLTVNNPELGLGGGRGRRELWRRTHRYRFQLALPPRHRGTVQGRNGEFPAGRRRLADHPARS